MAGADPFGELARLRREYRRESLDVGDVDPDPLVQFTIWFDEALAGKMFEPNAMSLATATPDGKPSLRIVLLKDFGPAGFSFFTNYLSRKGAELAANPQAALLFYWGELERQVRIEGPVSRVSRETSEAYFHKRPRASQLGALASAQSEVLASREEMEAAFTELEQRHRDQAIPVPEHWGGYRLEPEVFEFWQGRENRMHDRIRYREAGDGWALDRLAP